MKFIIEIAVENYDGEQYVYAKDFTLNDLVKFAGLIELMKKNIDHTTWNWFNGLPEIWDGNRYVLDINKLELDFESNWGFKYADTCTDNSFGESTNFIKEFYLRFTPSGADRINDIKVYKVTEIL